MIWQEIHLDDEQLWTNFYTYWINGQYENALNLLTSAKLQGKYFNKNMFNSIYTMLTTLQNNPVGDFKADRIKLSETPPTGMSVGDVYFKIN